MGSWITYGLGTEAEDLPGFVVLTSLGKGGQNQPIAARQWSSGFLPSKYQGVQLRAKGDPVLYLTNPNGVTRDRQGADVAAINALNKQHDALVDDPEIATRIAQYEMAFQMQASVPDLMDVSAKAPKRSNSTAASRATAPSPRTACSRVVSPSAARVSSSSITRTGTTTAA
jgi:hypothetical protein